MDHSDTTEKQILLFDLIKKIKKKYQVAVSSHVPLPDWIVRECDYFIFDKKNLLLYDSHLKHYKNFNTQGFYIEYKPIENISAHVISILRLIYMVNSSLKSMGYKIVHQIEYDCKMINFDELEENKSRLNEYDVVGYVENIYENSLENPVWIHGVCQTINLESFNQTDLSYDEKYLIKKLEECFNERPDYCQEKLITRTIYSNKKLFFKKLENVKKSIEYNLFTSQKNIWNSENSYSIFFKDNRFYLFFENNGSHELQKIKIILDDHIVRNYEVLPFNWLLFDLEYIPQNSVHVILNDSYIKKFNLTLNSDLSFLNSTNIFFK